MGRSYTTWKHEEKPTKGVCHCSMSGVLDAARLPRTARRAVTHGRARGMTLVELLAVVMIVGILSTVVIARIGSGSVGRPGVRGEARRLALNLRHARNLAITQGTNHYVGFDATGYAVYRRDSPTDVVVEPHRTLLRGVDGTISAWKFEFEPTGASLAAYWCNIFGSGVTYRIDIIIVTGLTTMREL